jgi:RNA polymerase sigma-70 factor (ECF subfamily)
MERNHGQDEWLMRAVARGQRGHMTTLLRRHASPLLTFIQRMVGDPHRAEELFQEVFLAVWIRRGTYEYPRPFRPWLFGIAMNQCRAEFRRRTRFPVVLQEDPGEPLATAGPSPVDAAIASETATLVATAVAQLPPAQRSVVVLRIWNGLSYAQIAQTMGVGEATARSHMFHGLAAVRKYLEPRLK